MVEIDPIETDPAPMELTALSEGARRVAGVGQAHACFFRTASAADGRKALLQITERCDLHCAHCFVSATHEGNDMSSSVIRDVVIPRLRRCRVTRLTLTGGEPFVHEGLIEICELAVRAGLDVGVCTNGTSVTDEQIDQLKRLGNIHVNVSLDGFHRESHGRFRGNVTSFDVTVATIRRLAQAGLLQGLLSTPNALTTPDEFRELAAFAGENGADYVLMNPLSALGRGVKSRAKLGVNADEMREVERRAREGAAGRLEIVPIRFPNDSAPLTPCIAGDIVYVFVNGDVAVCPYLVFAARSPRSQYKDSTFIVGNVLEGEIADALDNYNFHKRFTVGTNSTCRSCQLNSKCGKGCPAAVIAEGGLIGDRDVETCPIP
jgi:radical SAM protein with 4Fe4S-binding SPASM domain